jgi:phosphate transport system protein
MEHAVKSYENELDLLRSLTLSLGKLTGEQLGRALDAIESSGADSAARVIEREPEADRLEHEIDTLVARILALRQPVASDLRHILASLRIANELERICDYAEDLAKRVMAMSGSPAALSGSLINLGRFSATMVQDAMDAYAGRNVDKARDVWGRDKDLDDLYTGLFRELLTYMMEDPHQISVSTHMLFMARAIERVGDRATNIAEMVTYLVSGVPVAEQRPKADTTKSMILPDTRPSH